MGQQAQLKARYARRKKSIRKKIEGSTERPRLTVHKSLRYISAQIIDDSTGITLVAASSNEQALASGKNVDVAKTVGKALGDRAKEKNIEKIVFDRNGYPYHGKVKALADAAREAGLKF